MELRQLRYFLAVAEELNFTRAATKIGIAQPPLSQQIMTLEHQLGRPLFVRTKRKVELTPAGEVLVERARRIITLCEELEQAVLASGDPMIQRVRIGAMYTVIRQLVPTIVRECAAAHPNLRLEVRELTVAQQHDGLLGGTIDLAIVRGVFHGSTLASRKLFDEPFLAALPESLGITDEVVTPEWLAVQSFVSMSRPTNPHYDNLFRLLPSPLNGDLHIVQETMDMHTLLCLVAGGIGVALVPRSASTGQINGISYHRIAGDIPMSSVSLFWRKDDDELLHQIVDDIAAVATRIAGSHAEAPFAAAQDTGESHMTID